MCSNGKGWKNSMRKQMVQWTNVPEDEHFVYVNGEMKKITGNNNARRAMRMSEDNPPMDDFPENQDPEIVLPEPIVDENDEILLPNPINEEDGLLDPIDDDNDDIFLPGPIDEDGEDVIILPIDDGTDFPDKEQPDKEEPSEPSIPQAQKCTWGPNYYCQSEGVFSTCRSGGPEQFASECKLIRDGMLTKCEDLGKKFWCSSQSNFNYCVASQGFTGDMANFSACKPSRVGGRKNCKRCGRCITQIYNINSCACDKRLERR